MIWRSKGDNKEERAAVLPPFLLCYLVPTSVPWKSQPTRNLSSKRGNKEGRLAALSSLLPQRALFIFWLNHR